MPRENFYFRDRYHFFSKSTVHDSPVRKRKTVSYKAGLYILESTLFSGMYIIIQVQEHGLLGLLAGPKSRGKDVFHIDFWK